MTGTEKQIAYANDIKDNAIRNLQNNIERMGDEPLFVNNVRAFKLMIAVVEAVFAAQTDAVKVINRKESFAPSELFRTCDRWAEMLTANKTTITELAARNGLKDYKED